MAATDYKPNRNTAVITVIVIAVVLFCIAFFKTHQLIISITVTGLVIMLSFTWSYLNEQVVSIIIHPEKKMLSAYVWSWHKKKIIQLSLEEITITYKEEIGAKGTKRPSLKIYKKGKLLLEIIPGISGWSNKTLEQIAEHVQLINSGYFNAAK